MRPGTLFVALVLAVVVVVVFRWRGSPKAAHVHPKPSAVVDTSPVCPWREPLHDLSVLFPPSTNYLTETRILSGLTAELDRRLGRHMTADENPLRIHRARHDGTTLGSILVTRVKGAHGGIEIVTGVDTNGAVRGVLIQSQREPESVAAVITGPDFLASFAGKTASSPLRLGEDLPAVAEAARASAQAIADGVRGQLIVLSFAERRSADILSARPSANPRLPQTPGGLADRLSALRSAPGDSR